MVRLPAPGVAVHRGRSVLIAGSSGFWPGRSGAAAMIGSACWRWRLYRADGAEHSLLRAMVAAILTGDRDLRHRHAVADHAVPERRARPRPARQRLRGPGRRGRLPRAEPGVPGRHRHPLTDGSGAADFLRRGMPLRPGRSPHRSAPSPSAPRRSGCATTPVRASKAINIATAPAITIAVYPLGRSVVSVSRRCRAIPAMHRGSRRWHGCRWRNSCARRRIRGAPRGRDGGRHAAAWRRRRRLGADHRAMVVVDAWQSARCRRGIYPTCCPGRSIDHRVRQIDSGCWCRLVCARRDRARRLAGACPHVQRSLLAAIAVRLGFLFVAVGLPGLSRDRSSKG